MLKCIQSRRAQACLVLLHLLPHLLLHSQRVSLLDTFSNLLTPVAASGLFLLTSSLFSHWAAREKCASLFSSDLS